MNPDDDDDDVADRRKRVSFTSVLKPPPSLPHHGSLSARIDGVASLGVVISSSPRPSHNSANPRELLQRVVVVWVSVPPILGQSICPMIPLHPPHGTATTFDCTSCPTRSLSHRIGSHTSPCPTSPDALHHPCRRQRTDHSVIPLYTYSESNTTINLFPGHLLSNGCKTHRSSPLLTLWRSVTGTGAEKMRGASPCQTPYPACIQSPTFFAEPSVYSTLHPRALQLP